MLEQGIKTAFWQIDAGGYGDRHESCLDQAFDYLLVDVDMPAPGGMALIESWHQAGQHERVLALLTTDNQRREIGRLRELGVQVHLMKPVGRGDISAALMLLEQQGRERQSDFGPAQPEASRSLRILLVDDNPVNQEAARRLSKTGAQDQDCQPWWRGGGYVRARVIRCDPADMQMPVMGGSRRGGDPARTAA